MTDSPLVQALRNRKKPQESSTESERLLQMILTQVTKVADYFMADENESDIVTTQQSHAP